MVICEREKEEEKKKTKVDKGEEEKKISHAAGGRVVSEPRFTSWCPKGKPEAAILERKRESGVPLFCVPRQRRSSQPENVSYQYCYFPLLAIINVVNCLKDDIFSRSDSMA